MDLNSFICFEIALCFSTNNIFKAALSKSLLYNLICVGEVRLAVSIV